MSPTRFVFEEWDGVVREVSAHAGDAAYLILEDRSLRDAVEQLGRFDWAAMPDAMATGDDDRDDDADEDEGGLYARPADDEEPETDSRAEQALLWIKRKAENNCVGDARRKL